MAIVSFSEAARLAGVARSTIFRQVKRGELSATRLPDGTRGVDTAELERVYGSLATVQRGEMRPSAPSQATVHETELLRNQVQQLLQQLETAQEEKRQLWDMWEQESRERRALEQRLLSAPLKRGLVARLLGRFRKGD